LRCLRRSDRELVFPGRTFTVSSRQHEAATDVVLA
jgi:hypothetical protein